MAATARALAIIELLERVCSFNDDSTNASLACVCRTWSEVALRQLWSKVESVTALMTTLSPLQLQEEDSTLTFVDENAFGVRSWDRFSRYCSYTKFLYLEPGYKDEVPVDISVFDEVARTRPPQVLMPQLKSFRFTISQPGDCDYIPYASLFFHVNLKSFTLSRRHKVIPVGTYRMHRLFRDVITRAPNLTELHLHPDINGFIEEYGDDAFVAFLLELRALELLHVTLSATATIIAALAKSSRLRFLVFGPRCQEVTQSHWRSRHANLDNFRSLQTLYLSGTAGSLSPDLLAAFGKTTKLVQLFVNIDGPYTFEDLQSILAGIFALQPGSRKTELKRFDVTCKSDSGPHPTLDLPFKQFLWPVSAWKQLQTVRLTFFRPVSISNAEIEELASTLPYMRSFRLQWSSLIPPENAPTLDVFAKLARTWSRLHTLELYVDATDTTALPILPPSHAAAPFPRLRSLLLKSSPIEDGRSTVRIAAYLSRYLHSEDVLRVDDETTIRNGTTPRRDVQTAIRRAMLWQQVKDALPTFMQIHEAHRATVNQLHTQLGALERAVDDSIQDGDLSI